jgi:hypothetical protein
VDAYISSGPGACCGRSPPLLTLANCLVSITHSDTPAWAPTFIGKTPPAHESARAPGDDDLGCAHTLLCARQLLHLWRGQRHRLQRAREGAAQPQCAAQVAVALEHVRHALARSNRLRVFVGVKQTQAEGQAVGQM